MVTGGDRWHRLVWRIAVSVSVLLSAGHAAARCLPVPLARDHVPIFQSTDPAIEVGILTRDNAADLLLCRIEGEWARVYLMPMFYWMRRSDLAPDPRTERIVRMEVPPNGEIPYRQDWCHEATTLPLRTPIFLRGDHDVIVETRILPRWTPLIACGQVGAWTDIQFEGRRGYVETRHILVSTAQRERTRGFEPSFACRVFFWKARTIQETPVFRWSATGDLEEGTLPPDREIEIGHARGPWLWSGYGGQWWYVAISDVAVLPQLFETTRIADREPECGGFFRRATAVSDVPMYQSALSEEVVITVPQGGEFVVFQEAESGRFRARYLSVTGWVDEQGWNATSEETSLVALRIPDGFQASTLVSVVQKVEEVPWHWRMGLLLGPAASGNLPRPGALVDFVTALRLGSVGSLAAGISGLVSDGVTAVGSDLGVSMRLDLSGASFLDLWMAASVQRIEAEEVGLGIGGRISMTLGLPIQRPYDFGLAYSFRGNWVPLCTGQRPCAGSDGWFLHAVQIVLGVRL